MSKNCQFDQKANNFGAQIIFLKIAKNPQFDENEDNFDSQIIVVKIYFVKNPNLPPTTYALICLKFYSFISGSKDANLYVYTGGDRSFLYLRRAVVISKSDEDEYICLGKNKYGTVRSRPAYLKISDN